MPIERIKAYAPKGIILSGGPMSVYVDDAPQLDPEILELGIPVLGICYGMQSLALHLGGTVARTDLSEFGKTALSVLQPGLLLEGLRGEEQAWMSHRDSVTKAPPGFEVLAASAASPVAAMEARSRGFYGVQFHPEVLHTPKGTEVLKNFLYKACGCAPAFTPASIIEESIKQIRAQVGDDKAILGLSGGVDSSVAALLMYKAIGERLTCVFVDQGMMRMREAERVVETFAGTFGIPLIAVDASDRFLDKLEGVTEPERKRKIIGEEFIRCFEEEARKLIDAKFLVQGTLYSDVIESGTRQAAKIKSHHNVGGLPEKMDFELVEPLRWLFKDEVRAVGEELGLPERIVWRQPFPGPGPRHPHHRRDHARARRHPAARRRHRAGGDPQGRPLPRALAVLRHPARDPQRGRAGRRAHLRLPDRHPGGQERRRHDRRLGAPALRPSRDALLAHHQRGARGQPRGLRHLEQAAEHHRVGVGLTRESAHRPCCAASASAGPSSAALR